MVQNDMDNTSPSSKSDETSAFIRSTAIEEFCRATSGLEVKSSNIHRLVENHILPIYQSHSETWVLVQDVLSLLPTLAAMASLDEAAELGPLWGGTRGKNGIWLYPNAKIDFTSERDKVEPTYFAAVRNLAQIAYSSDFDSSATMSTVPYYPPTLLTTSASELREHSNKQLRRSYDLNLSRASQFANSVYYMGSKKELAGFLVEAVDSILPVHGTVIDLMCGSGAAAEAFSRTWKTIASDLQEFCQILATVQGAGFSLHSAQRLLDSLLPAAHKHAEILSSKILTFLDQEDRFLYGDVGPRLLKEYQRFVAAFPTYPSETFVDEWAPFKEVEERKRDPRLQPYCLFTSYFANVYFGLRQCVEIDSLRFSIDQICDEHNRAWALGALIAAVSALGTTYGGHFAQPRFKKPEDIAIEGGKYNLSWLLRQRTFSIIHEFSARLLNLSSESESAPRPIDIVPGPWQVAIDYLDAAAISGPVLVYIDAPYKREEYSRYYHVLETLVTYRYPASIGSGRIPSKANSERPSSEFFTRSSEQVTKVFVQMIAEILGRGWSCAWSYSDTGAIDIKSVVERVTLRTNCTVHSFATPHSHKAQGGRRERKVTEYLIVLQCKSA
jgi:adenine-specific DNA-methyltransferase